MYIYIYIYVWLKFNLNIFSMKNFILSVALLAVVSFTANAKTSTVNTGQTDCDSVQIATYYAAMGAGLSSTVATAMANAAYWNCMDNRRTSRSTVVVEATPTTSELEQQN